MSSVSGSSSQNPNPIPEDPNNRLDLDTTDSSSKDQEGASSPGVTETGLSVEVLSIGELSSIDGAIAGVQHIANAIIATGGAPSSLSPATGAAVFAEEIVTDFYDEGAGREELERIEEKMEELFAGIEASETLVDDLKRKLHNFQKDRLASVGQPSKKSHSGKGPDLEEQFLDLRRDLASLNGRANELESIAFRLTSSLSDGHNALMGMSLEDFREAMGDSADLFLEKLGAMGLVYGENGWKIDPQGSIPRLALETQRTRAILEHLPIPTEEEFIQAASEDTISCCQAFVNRLRALWNTLVQMFYEIYNSMIFFLFWILRKSRIKQLPSSVNSENNPVFENPFASASGTSSTGGSNSSVRSSVSGRSDLSDEDVIRRPEDSAIDAQSVDNQEDEDGGDSLEDF
ncbi:conserved hypothetical protein [Chlamydia felis Fe/C-56]|uniref:Uncharacterized protein n=1 Tax=Chlamydia felis (strain Fe/C-56) TaxID=264202 RepID=Q253K5_CHLFF|nr:hypothetical protein [Chlamydia felis]BAE81533.1 conserved hypothetical protein [Chlamydia felis Fe/C-56]